MTRRAVVYRYSQTGQLFEVVDAFTAPLVGRGWEIRTVPVTPVQPFPFPWPVTRFFSLFPAAVDPSARVQLVATDFSSAPDELVILAYQVWYLAPSLPIRSLLTIHPESMRDRDVVTVVACRNMWYSAACEVAGLLRDAGARSVAVVAATDTRPQAVTFVTTLRWLLTGRRDGRMGRAGVGPDELARVAAVGRQYAETDAVTPSPVAPALAAADLLAGRVFRRWGGVVRRFGAVALVVFVLGLGAGIVLVLPLLALTALLGGRRFADAVRGYVARGTTFARAEAA